MKSELFIGTGDTKAVWDKIVDSVMKSYGGFDKNDLVKCDTISLSCELFEITYQRTKGMVGMIIIPSVVNDFNNVKLYILADEDIINDVLRDDESVYNKIYNEFLSVIDDEGLGFDFEVNILENNEHIESYFMKYLNIYNFIPYSTLKFNKLFVEESQETGSGRVILKNRKLFSIMKSGVLHPVIEMIGYHSSSSNDYNGYM